MIKFLIGRLLCGQGKLNRIVIYRELWEQEMDLEFSMLV